MKSKTTTLITVACLFFSMNGYLHAQIDPNIYANYKDLQKMKERTLIVEIKEEDPKLVAKLSKKEKNADRLENYRNFISNNNEMLKKAVDKYWKLNANIEYKTTTELKDIVKKSSDYVILSYRTMGDVDEEGMYTTLGVPVLFYNRSERNPNREPDYFIYLPASSIPEKENSPTMWTYVQSDYDFAVQQMQNNINWMLDNQKTMNYEDYAKMMAKSNCKKIHRSTLLIDRGQLYEKCDEQDIKSVYKGPYELTDTKSTDDAYVNRESGKEVVFMFAYGILKGAFGMSALAFSKVVVDCNTNDIFYMYKAPMFGVLYIEFDLRKQVFENMDDGNI